MKQLKQRFVPSVIGAFVGAFFGPGVLIVAIVLFRMIFTLGASEDGQGFVFVVQAVPLGLILGGVLGCVVGASIGMWEEE